MKDIRRVLLPLVAALTIALAGAAPALATPPSSPPGQGECAHGNSEKPCKDDPQPSHGQDCDEHGPHEGGVNEDHCSPSPSSSVTPDPTSSPTPSATPVGSETPSEPPQTTPSPSSSTPPSTSTPSSPPSVTPTLPPTDTQPSASADISVPGWSFIIIGLWLIAIAYLAAHRPRR